MIVLEAGRQRVEMNGMDARRFETMPPQSRYELCRGVLVSQRNADAGIGMARRLRIDPLMSPQCYQSRRLRGTHVQGD